MDKFIKGFLTGNVTGGTLMYVALKLGLDKKTQKIVKDTVKHIKERGKAFMEEVDTREE